MNKPIRVLCVFSCLERGGSETMCMNLYRAIDRKKVQFDFVKHTQDIGAYEEEIIALGGRVFSAPKIQLTSYYNYTDWWKNHFIGHEEHNIIHIFYFTCTAVIAPIVHKHNRYVVGHCHTSFRVSNVKSFIEKRFIRIGGTQVDYALACSDKAGRFMFGKREYHVLNNAIDTGLYRYNPIIRQRCRNYLSNDIIIGHIGRFVPVKNHHFLLDIFSVIKKKKEHTKLMLVGDGPLRNEIEEYARHLGLENDIIFTGVRSDVNELVQAMDFFVFPSLFEGLPVTIVEAQASGLPCVISDTVPDECILTKDLVTIMSLKQSAEEWANHILSRLGKPRVSHAEEVRAHGYDIAETSKWLEEFYLSKANETR